MAKKVGEYPYTLTSLIFNNQEYKECCEESLLLKQYDIETLSEFLNVELTEEEQKYLEEQQKRKIKKGANGILLSKIKTLDEHFVEVESKSERNKATMVAYKDGYKQIEIAQYLGLSKSHVSKVLKEVEI
jgi:DNA-binding NarL/FixJ family response regulator